MKRPEIDSTADVITSEAVAHSSAKMVPAGSVLCVMRSGILQHTFPVAVCTVDVTLNQDMRALVLAEDADPCFVAHYLRKSSWSILGTCSKAGTTVSSIEAPRLDRYPIPLPPLDTQRRIVLRIDELFAELADGDAALAIAKADLEIYRQSLLKAAVTGELTADWREANQPHETGEELLHRILSRRRSEVASAGAGRRRTPDPVWADQSGTPSIPASWAWASLEQLSSGVPHAISDGPFGSNLKSEHYRPSGPRVVRLQNVGRDGDYIDARAHIAEEHFQSLGRHHVLSGDLIVAILGEPLPRAVIVPADFGPGLVKADCIKVRMSDSRYAMLTWAWMNCTIAHALVADSVKGVGRPRISMGQIKAMPIPLPSDAELIPLLGRLDEALDAFHVAETQIADLIAAVADLRQSILAAAFRGELVQ